VDSGSEFLQRKMKVVMLEKVHPRARNSVLFSTNGWIGIGLGFMLVLMHGLMAWSAAAQAEGNADVFVGQGQAVYYPLDASRSQREAIRDLQAQAVIQAAARVLSSAQLAKQVQIIQKKILNQPERFVQSYRVFSENPYEGGLYRVIGQVSVVMDKLKKELIVLGLDPSGVETPQHATAQPASKASPTGEKVGESGKTLDKTDQSSVGGKEILWAVAENWEDEWHLPGDHKDPKALFAACVFEGSKDYNWSIHYPGTGTLTPDAHGEVSTSRVLTQAKAMGLPHVVIGSLAPIQGDDGEGRLRVSLRLVSVSSGKTQEEIMRESVIGDSSNQEAALELADLIVPQLDRQLREPTFSAPVAETEVKPVEAGELVLQIKSKDAYADWLPLEKALREQFKTMQVKGFEIRPEQSVVRLQGVDKTGLRNLHGTRLSNGAQVQIVSLDGENYAFDVTFLRSGMSQAEPRP
jgi:hypothetical protein